MASYSGLLCLAGASLAHAVPSLLCHIKKIYVVLVSAKPAGVLRFSNVSEGFTVYYVFS